jgi:hypothetical protein
MTWHELKGKLKNKIEKDDIHIVCKILDEILRFDNDKNVITSILCRLFNLKKDNTRGTLSPEHFRRVKNEINASLIDFMYGFDESILIENWIDNNYVQSVFNQDGEGKSKPIINTIPITIERNLIQVPMTAGLEKPEKQHKYKIELMKAQDYIVIGDYMRAYNCCKDVIQNLEMESPQLYEFMLLTYFYNEGVKNIIDETLRGAGEKLKTLKLYADRCHTLNELSV